MLISLKKLHSLRIMWIELDKMISYPQEFHRVLLDHKVFYISKLGVRMCSFTHIHTAY